MEEKYPELGNLSPRDVVSREIELVRKDKNCGNQVFLDMTGLDSSVWENKLSDLREECIRYLGKDPAAVPVEVSPGIHYFMGGINVDEAHRTSISRLYAAGECACQYHGANRLGGNSMLGAVFGGQTAAQTAAAEVIFLKMLYTKCRSLLTEKKTLCKGTACCSVRLFCSVR